MACCAQRMKIHGAKRTYMKEIKFQFEFQNGLSQ